MLKGVDWKRWAFALIPAAALLELAAHGWQATHTVPERDWLAARDAVKALIKPEDDLVFAPHWTDPLGRRYFGDELATVAREAAPDVTRFPRAVEVSIRGAHAPELQGWPVAAQQRVGAITVRTLTNPSPVKVLDDLLTHVPEHMMVVRVEGAREQPCAFARATPQSGGLGFGPTVPAERFVCQGGGFVGVSVMATLDYTARRCLFAPPPSGDGLVRITFRDVTFGRILHGHHGLYVEAERNRDGAPVRLVWRAGDRQIAELVHHDGDGWRGFELPTDELAGQQGDLVAEVSSPHGNRRLYCFEADLR